MRARPRRCDIADIADTAVRNSLQQTGHALRRVRRSAVDAGLDPPGAMLLTRMRWMPSSCAMLAISIETPPLDAR